MTSTSILATKLHIPRSPGPIVPRPHLMERLDDGLRGNLTLHGVSRPMEVEAILGEPVRQAALAGVAMPIVAELCRLATVVNLAKCREAR